MREERSFKSHQLDYVKCKLIFMFLWQNALDACRYGLFQEDFNSHVLIIKDSHLYTAFVRRNTEKNFVPSLFG